MTESSYALPPPRTPEWLVCDEARDNLAALDPVLRRLVTRNAPRPIPHRPELVARGGKRLRAALVLLSGAFGTRRDALLRAAMIPELLHTGSLIQDDIMDGADTRRGAPALYRVVGARTASLFASRLYCAAFGIVTGLPVDVRDRAVRAARDLCRGQCLELLSQGDPRLTPAVYHRIVAGKTASLFAVAAWLGARVSGASDRRVRALESFGQRFGMLYQIVDDVMDLFGDEREIGKPTGQDLDRRVFTLPLVYWLTECPTHPLARRLRHGDPLTTDQSAALVCDLRRSSSIERVLSDADTWTRGAEMRLSCLPEGPARESLRRLLSSVADLPRHLVSRTRRVFGTGRTSLQRPDVDPRDGPSAALDAILPDRDERTRAVSEWSVFCADLSRELPWFGERMQLVERRLRQRLLGVDRALADRVQYRRQAATVVEGLIAALPVLFGGCGARQVEVAVALELLLASERCQRRLDGDPLRQSGRILAADLLLCEFMAVLAALPASSAECLAHAAETYMARVARNVHDRDPQRVSARRRLSLAAWEVDTELGRQAGLRTFVKEKIGRLLDGADRLDLPGVRSDPSTLLSWTHSLGEDAGRLAGWLHDRLRHPPLAVGGPAEIADPPWCTTGN